MPEHDPGRTVPRPKDPPSDSTVDHAETPDTNAGEPRPSDKVTVVRPPSDAPPGAPAGSAAAGVGVSVPGYVILSELGRGGMGVVYTARHAKLNRVVALKMMLGEGRASRGDLIRFLAEAEAVAAIRHENVVQVFDYGDADGRPFMALEFLPGGTLATRLILIRKLGGDGDSVRDAVALVAQVARGVAAAHALGIVHRDLKPGNVFLDVSGVPKVADFGLAKRGDGTDVTQTGQVMGTPAYMSPEQAKGETKFVGPQADVWALGVILYEALTGQRPFAGSVQEILAQIQSVDPAPPRKLRPDLSRDLELICLNCLAKPAHERYPTAKELADDLDRFLRHEPISVRPAGAVERGYKWARRKPTLATAYALSLATVMLVAVAAGLGALLQVAQNEKRIADTERGNAETARAAADSARLETQERNKELAAAKLTAEGAKDDAVKARTVAEELRDKAKSDAQRIARLEAERSIDLAYRAYQAGDVAQARKLINACPLQHRHWEWHYVHRLCYQDLVTFTGHRGPVTGVAVSDDGRSVATVSSDGTARVWEPDLGTERLAISLPGRWSFRAIAFTDAGDLVIASDESAVVCSGETGKVLNTFRGHTRKVYAVGFDSKRGLAYSTDEAGATKFWNPKTGAVASTITEPDAAAFATSALHAKSGVLATAGYKMFDIAFTRDAHLWDAASGKLLHTLKGHTGHVTGVGFRPDGRRLATVSSDRKVRVWTARTGELSGTFEGHAQDVTAVCFAPGGKHLATGGDDATVRIWEELSRLPPLVLKGHAGGVTGVAYLPHGRKLVTSSDDWTARVWDATVSKEVRPFGPVFEKIKAVCFTPDSEWVAVASDDDRTCRIFHAATGELRHTLAGHSGRLESAAFSGDGKRIAVGDDGKAARVWDAETGELVATFPGHDFRVGSVLLSADGRKLVTTDNKVRVWDVDAKKPLPAPVLKITNACRAALSPDGRLLVTGHTDNSVRVWDFATAREVRTLPCGDPRGIDGILALRFSPDGGLLAAVDSHAVLRTWAVGTWEERSKLEFGWNPENIRHVDLTADLKRLVTGGQGAPKDEKRFGAPPPPKPPGPAPNPEDRPIPDVFVRIWDAEEGRLLLTLTPDASDTGTVPSVWSVAFSPDGKLLGVGGGKCRAFVYDSRPVNRRFRPPEAAPAPREVAR
jgi:WD40 repeat protein/tRNA A-37 threonylcarbamoyl transferase component Bud32